MKNKLLILNIISFIILYHVVYEFIYFFLNNEDYVTPLGYYLFYYEDESISDKPKLFSLTISFLSYLFISLIFWRYLYKWENKKDTVALIFNLLYLYSIIAVILFVLSLILIYLTKSSISVIYFMFYIPMLIMAILMVPLFRFNQWILSKSSK